MARPELGTKRVCLECGAKYYDLNRDPITCPKCGTIFEMDTPKPAEVAEVEEQEDEVVAESDDAAEEAGAEVISLEDADAEQASDIDVPDLDDDDSNDDDDVFLDDEEDEEALGAIGLDVAVSSDDED
ncbi:MULTISPECIES: TIGR02300 family protein [Cohaesibacter]|uniref:TIGR02300 family protein n=1 Tax=Cohaesibacter TaxID=655352 RepID=UPI000DEA75D3|nr:MULTISPECIES: TIGR02300 family protein [Cohaesibacter]TLP46067.1 TIGR02300 family protein [Cohaesibacter sp. CAU 1516]